MLSLEAGPAQELLWVNTSCVCSGSSSDGAQRCRTSCSDPVGAADGELEQLHNKQAQHGDGNAAAGPAPLPRGL